MVCLHKTGGVIAELEDDLYAYSIAFIMTMCIQHVSLQDNKIVIINLLLMLAVLLLV